jgi:phage replication-related protein YjqB (UPF0714/DUF867 family)
MRCGPAIPVVPQPCGPSSGGNPINAVKKLNQDFFIGYNLKAENPAMCTAFAIHGGNIDKGVHGIVDGMLYCKGYWGNYEFSGNSFDDHVTEVLFNEPCYVMLRAMGQTKIHIHSNIRAEPNTICIGTNAMSTAPYFKDQLLAALAARNIKDVTVEYNKTGKCAQSPAKTGRDNLGLEIHQGLAIEMAKEAYHCENLSGKFGALVDALNQSFPNCFADKRPGGNSTFSSPGCGVGY